MSLISLLVYIPLQIAFIPIAVVGVVLVGWRQMVVSKRLGVSQTAIEVLNGRWTMHVFGIRADPACTKLATALPNTSTTGLWLVLFPLWLKFRMSGKLFLYPRVPAPGAETLGEIVTSRTLYFGQVIERVIGQIDQFVVMGAGYDTRAYGGLPGNVRCFEVDQASVQQHKRDALGDAGIASDHVSFVAVDFTVDNAMDKLAEAGFDASKRTLFLWEGVTLYLPEADVRKTMQDVRGHAPSGSVLLADFYADYFVNIGKRSSVSKTLDYTGEGFAFSLPFAVEHEQTLREFVESESMSLGEAHFMGSNNDKGPFMVVAEMKW